MPASPMPGRASASDSDHGPEPPPEAASVIPICYDRTMTRLFCTVALLLILAGCEGTSLHGSASEHGVRDIKLGVPL